MEDPCACARRYVGADTAHTPDPPRPSSHIVLCHLAVRTLAANGEAVDVGVVSSRAGRACRQAQSAGIVPLIIMHALVIDRDADRIASLCTGEQAVHSALPLRLAMRPLSHRVQLDEPARGARRPVGQGEHADRPSPLEYP